MTIKIGAVTLPNNVFLAPMAGVTDATFRGLCASFGCGLTYTEMVSAKGMRHNNKNTAALLEGSSQETMKAVQLFGSHEDILADMAARLQDFPIDIIDINMGCPARKIVGNGDGSALMGDPEKIGRIVSKVSKATQKPVTVKIRKGIDERNCNAVEVAKIAEDNGASAVAVHGRFATQFYSGKADWDIIRRVKEAVKIPVIGNGDVTDTDTYLKMLEKTNCDAVMIGRGAQGNPWIFKEITHYLRTGKRLPPPSTEERIEIALAHTQKVIETKGEYTGVREMRKHLGWYVKGMSGASELRRVIHQALSYKDVQDIFEKYLAYAAANRE